MTKYTRTSILTGKTRTREIDVSEEQYRDWQSGTLIQDAMPTVDPAEREFLMTGITPEEWQDFLIGEAGVTELWPNEDLSEDLGEEVQLDEPINKFDYNWNNGPAGQ